MKRVFNLWCAAGGMSGALVPPEGEVCAAVVASPFRTLGDDITSNATCTALYVNPPHQQHVARPLADQGFEVRLSASLCFSVHADDTGIA